MAKVGMPVTFLDRRNHSRAEIEKGRKGNAKKVLQEALTERYGVDSDIDHSLSGKNVFLFNDSMHFQGRCSGKEMNDYWEQMANDYEVTDKNGKTRKLRSDAYIGFAGICNPADEYISTMSFDEQKTFFKRSAAWIRNAYAERGMVIDMFVIHFDEGSPNMHYFGHDPEYRVTKKLNLPFFSKLNKEYPKYMREHGYDVQDLVGYDVEATKNMSEDELKAYKQAHIAEKKEKHHGEPTLKYKRRKNEERERQLDAREMQQNAQRDVLQKQAEELSIKQSAITQQQSQNEAKRNELEELEKLLMDEKTTLDDLIEREHAEIEKTLSSVGYINEQVEVRKKELKQRADALGVNVTERQQKKFKREPEIDY